MAGKIFINYRRDDSTGTAGRMHDRLAEAFGRKNLFMDVDHIPAGVDFVEYLRAQLAACDVFLAVIGPNWLQAKDDSGNLRLHDPNDFVAIEIAAALARNIRVIPVLIDGARMPAASELPESLKPLVRRQAVELRHTHFGRDAEALNDKIREARRAETLLPGRRLALPAAAVALLLIGGIGLSQFGIPVGWEPSPDAPRMRRSGAQQPSATAGSEAGRQSNQVEQQQQTSLKAGEVRRQPEAASAGGISDCPDDYRAFDADSPPLACTCSAEATRRGNVWGMDVYTGDSEVCRAALHAGVIGKDGGPVTIISEPGRKSYPGVTRNDVKSGNWSEFKNSFRFAANATAGPNHKAD
ncbi:LCCL domain-containing protein [Microvirga massiliensis]|uniref:LCCL domain-containing protein n=1 Tax=Microvirga massiliensis TaxID=1033741 RepID=UPI0006600F2D|nr:LCCL domain-containing protein [Microvirga massiliensis]